MVHFCIAGGKISKSANFLSRSASLMHLIDREPCWTEVTLTHQGKKRQLSKQGDAITIIERERAKQRSLMLAGIAGSSNRVTSLLLNLVWLCPADSLPIIVHPEKKGWWEMFRKTWIGPIGQVADYGIVQFEYFSLVRTSLPQLSLDSRALLPYLIMWQLSLSFAFPN